MEDIKSRTSRSKTTWATTGMRPARTWSLRLPWRTPQRRRPLLQMIQTGCRRNDPAEFTPNAFRHARRPATGPMRSAAVSRHTLSRPAMERRPSLGSGRPRTWRSFTNPWGTGLVRIRSSRRPGHSISTGLVPNLALLRGARFRSERIPGKAAEYIPRLGDDGNDPPYVPNRVGTHRRCRQGSEPRLDSGF
jgi:hypothetical protein